MKPLNTLGSIPPNQTLLGDVYRAYVKGEISKHEYELANAVWTANNVVQSRGLTYPAIPDRARRYADARLSGSAEYDGRSANELGRWRKTVTEIYEENKARIQNLSWAQEKLTAEEMNESAEICARQIRMIMAVTFPISDFRVALAAMELDSRSRPRRVST